MWPNPQVTADLVTFTEEILNRKLHFLCSDKNAMPVNIEKNFLSDLFDYLCDIISMGVIALIKARLNLVLNM